MWARVKEATKRGKQKLRMTSCHVGQTAPSVEENWDSEEEAEVEEMGDGEEQAE